MNEERHERWLKFRVGVFILVALLAFLGMIYALGARARLFEARYTIHTEFVEVAGISVGATVRLAGVQIGRVSGVHLPGQPGGKVRVDLNITKQYADRIRTDSVARIETQGLLGDKIIEISVGTAQASVVPPDGLIASREPVDIGQDMNQGAETVKNVAALAESLRETAVSFQQSRIVEDLSASTAAARRSSEQLARILEQTEKGRGWAHALLYEEPVALRRLNDLITTTQKFLDTTQGVVERVQRGEGAVGVLTSPESAAAARRFLAAMDRFGQITDAKNEEAGLLPALLFDPRYKALLNDFRVVAQNLRVVSERVVGGKGTLGGLVKDEPGDKKLGSAMEDLQVAVANLREITEKINEGEGTLGALIADPTIYERLADILGGAQRSFLLRSLIKGLGDDGKDAGEGRKGR